MNFEQFSSFASTAESVATVLAIGIGAYWTYIRFVRQRENYPLIEFTADIVLVGRQSGWWIVELVSVIENKGKVQHRIEEFAFDLAALYPDDPVEPNGDIGGQVYFPHAITKGSWLPERMKYFFIDPGTQARYSFITRIPERATFAILHSWFRYTGQRAGHTAERTVQIPAPTPV